MADRTINAPNVPASSYFIRDPYGTSVAERNGDGSVVRLVDPSGAVVATYHYCPTGNPAVPPTGPAAAGNPYQQYGLLHDAATDSNWLGGLRIDPDSGNASQPQFCLVLGGAFGFFCPRTSPAITGQQAQATLACPEEGSGPEHEAPLTSPRFVQSRGPESGTPQCHVNVEFRQPGVKRASVNYHVFYVGDDVYSAQITGILGRGDDSAPPLWYGASDATIGVINDIANKYLGETDAALLRGNLGFQGKLEDQIQNLQVYSP